MFGDPVIEKVGQIEEGKIINVIKVDVGGRGIVATRYLVLTKGGKAINGNDAKRSGNFQ